MIHYSLLEIDFFFFFLIRQQFSFVCVKIPWLRNRTIVLGGTRHGGKV